MKQSIPIGGSCRSRAVVNGTLDSALSFSPSITPMSMFHFITSMRKLWVWLPLFLLIGATASTWAQPTVLGSQVVNGGYSTYDLTNRGGGRFVRLQASSSAGALARNWEFVTGTSGTPNYSNNWRPYSGTCNANPNVQIVGYNTFIAPAAGFPAPTASATFNGGFGGCSGFLPAVTSGNYYTFNVTGNGGDNNMSVLETTYNPVSITSVTAPLVATVFQQQSVRVRATLSAALNAGENAVLRYSTDGFGSSLFINMSLVSGTTYEAVIPGQTAALTVQYYVLTTNNFGSISHANADMFTLNLRNATGENVAGSNYSYTVSGSAVRFTVSNGSWSTGSVWDGGTAPAANAICIIRHNVTLNQAATISGLVVNSGANFTSADGSSRTLTINNNSPITVEGNWINNTGSILTFSGASTVRGYNAITMQSVGIAGGVDFGTLGGSGLVTINNSLTINTGGFVNTNGVFYSATSTLFYTGNYTAATEWFSNATSGLGVPNNVIVNAGTLTLTGTSTDFRQCNLHLTKTGALTLNGCDLKIGGSLLGAGAFTANNKAIFFVGNARGTIVAGTTYAYIVIEKTAQKISLAGAVTINGGTGGGDALAFTNATSKLDINGQTLTVGQQINMAAGSAFLAGINSGSGTGTLVMLNGTGGSTGNVGTIRFQSDSAYLSVLTLNRPSAGGAVTFGSSVRAATFTRTAGSFTVNSGAVFQHNNAFSTGTSAYTIVVNGRWQSNGTMNLAATAASTVTVSGDNATLTSTGDFTLGSFTNITATSGATTGAFLTFGNVNFNGSLITLVASGANPKVLMTTNGVSGAGTTVTLNDNNWNITGKKGWTGTFNGGTSNVSYIGTGTQNVRGAAYYNLTISNNSVKTLLGNSSVTNDLTFSGTTPTLACAGFNLNISATGDRLIGTGTLTQAAGNITVAGNFSGTVTFSGTGTGQTTVAGNWTSNGNVSHTGATLGESIRVTGNFGGTGTLTLQNASAELFVDGNYTRTGTLNFATAGATLGLGGLFSVTPTISNANNSRWYYYGNSPQNIYPAGATIQRLRIKGAPGAHKTLPANFVMAVSDSFNCMSAINLIFPSNTSPQVTQLTITSYGATNAGAITPDPTGRITIGNTTVYTTPANNSNNRPRLSFNAGTLGWLDVQRNPGQDSPVLEILTSLSLGRYNFSSGSGHIRVAANADITIEGTSYAGFGVSPTGIASLTGNSTATAAKYWALGLNSNLIYNVTGSIAIGGNMLFPIGFNTAASPTYPASTIIGTGTFNSSTASTGVSGTGTLFTQELLVGDVLVRSDGTVIGTITNTSFAPTTITLQANALANTTNGQYFVRRFYRPATLLPANAIVTAGSQVFTVGYRLHTGGGTTNGTNIAPSASTRRSNILLYAQSTSPTTQFGMRMEGLISADFNQTMIPSQVSIFRTTGSLIWEKYRVDAGFGSTGAGGVANTFFQRDNLGELNANNLFAMGQTGGDLPDDPTFTWTGSTTDWLTPANWIASGTPALYPNSPAHFVNIGASGSANLALPASAISVATITHNAKSLTVPGNGTLNVAGQYVLNFPTGLLSGGTGTFTTAGATVTGDATTFDTQLVPGSYIYRASDNLFLGIVRTVTSATLFTLMNYGANIGVLENQTVPTAFNYITPAASSITGTVTALNGQQAISIAGGTFTAAMRGRVLLDATNNLIGVIAAVVDGSNALLAAPATADYTGTASIRGGISTSGSGSLICATNSTVVYGSNISQMFAPANYFNITFADARSLAITPAQIYRMSFATNQTITIRGKFTARYWVLHTPMTGLTYQFVNGSSLDLTVPGYAGGSPTAGQLWRGYNSFGTHPNVRFGTINSDRIDVRFEYNRNADLTFQGPEFTVFSNGRLGNLEYIRNSNNSFIVNSGNTIIVNGSAIFTNNSGFNDMMRLGNAAYSPGNECNVTFGGSVTYNGTTSATQNMLARFGGSLHNYTFRGPGLITFPAGRDPLNACLTTSGTTPGLLNLTYNKPGITYTIGQTSGTSHLVALNSITVSGGTLARGAAAASDISAATMLVNGTGEILHPGSGGIFAGNGNMTISGSGKVTHTGSGSTGVPPPATGGLIVSGSGSLNLASNTAVIGHGGVGFVTLSGGSITAPASPLSGFGTLGDFTITGGTFTKAAGFVNLGNSGVGGNLIFNGGTMNTSGATLRVDGTATQSFSSTTNRTATFNDVVINKGGGSFDVLSGRLRILSTLDVQTNTVVNTTPSGNITLAANNPNSARVAQLPNATATTQLLGTNWTVEKFVNSATTAGWHFLGTSIQGQTISDWGDDFAINTPLVAPSTLTVAANRTNFFAFDGTTPDPITTNEKNGWRVPTTINVVEGKGYRGFLNSQFFSGSRIIDNTGAITHGSFNFGVVHNPAGYAGSSGPGWNLVANPYPSTIDWNVANGSGWIRTNILGTYWTWNKTVSGGGSYATFAFGSPSGTNGATRFIPSNQGFLVVGQPGPVMSCDERIKSSTSTAFLRTAEEYTNAFKIGLSNAANTELDEIVIYERAEATDDFDPQWDGPKVSNPGMNFSTFATGGTPLAINAFAPIAGFKTIRTNVSVVSPGLYSLHFKFLGQMGAGVTMYLRDNYLGVVQQIVNDEEMVHFTVSSDPMSQGENRFDILFGSGTITSTGANSKLGNVTVFPNPSNGNEINLVGKDLQHDVTVSIFELTGKMVYSAKQEVVGGRLNTTIRPGLASGVYTIRVFGKTSVMSIKHVVE